MDVDRFMNKSSHSTTDSSDSSNSSDRLIFEAIPKSREDPFDFLYDDSAKIVAPEQEKVKKSRKRPNIVPPPQPARTRAPPTCPY